MSDVPSIYYNGIVGQLAYEIDWHLENNMIYERVEDQDLWKVSIRGFEIVDGREVFEYGDVVDGLVAASSPENLFEHIAWSLAIGYEEETDCVKI